MDEVRRDPESFLASEIRRRRDALGLTAQQLADRVAAEGGKLARQAISKIENGDRSVSIQELILLGKALRVPPLLLLLPVGREPTIEVLPGREVTTWGALRWVAGYIPFPTNFTAEDGPLSDPDDVKAWTSGAAPVRMYQEHDRLIGLWAAAMVDSTNNLRAAEHAVSEDARAKFLAEADEARSEARGVELQLGRHRRYMRDHDVEPEPIPGQLRHVDETSPNALGRGTGKLFIEEWKPEYGATYEPSAAVNESASDAETAGGATPGHTNELPREGGEPA